jgi:microcin C transport system permease protein
VLPNSLTPGRDLPAVSHERRHPGVDVAGLSGPGHPPGTPSLGELLSQGKDDIDAWWISLSTFAVLVLTPAAADVHGRCAA